MENQNKLLFEILISNKNEDNYSLLELGIIDNNLSNRMALYEPFYNGHHSTINSTNEILDFVNGKTNSLEFVWEKIDVTNNDYFPLVNIKIRVLTKLEALGEAKKFYNEKIIVIENLFNQGEINE